MQSQTHAVYLWESGTARRLFDGVTKIYSKLTFALPPIFLLFRYFDIVEIAVETFYSLSMEDVLDLCETHPVNEQDKNIDYPMIALAYRLSYFDKDLAWEDYLSFE